MSAVPKPALAAERKQFYDKIDKANVTPLWEVLHGLITATPNTPCKPYLWHWDTVYPWILVAGKLITAKEYASYSDDGGVTWAPNQRISNQKMKINCTSCPGGGTPRYQGDYDAIISHNNQALAMWTDFRSGNFGSFVGYFTHFAMTISETADTIKPDGSINVTIRVPAVKLYDKSVKFSVESVPPANFVYQFPQGDSLSSFPDSVSLTINANNVPDDNYTIRIFGRGPNGTPVHERNIELLVTNLVTKSFTA